LADARIIGMLSEELSGHALDLPGHGESDNRPSDGIRAELVEDIVRLLDHLNIKRHIVANSMEA